MMALARRVVFAMPLLAGLGGCVSIASDACTDVGAGGSVVLNEKDVTPRNCDGNFFSARRQRDVLYAGDDKPRLWSGEAARHGRDIDTSVVNAPPPGFGPARSVTAYMGTLKINYDANNDMAAADVAAVRNANARFDPDQKVAIDFRKATIDHVLKQMLGGALGLNYVAPDDLGGSVTFRTEEPVAKSQVLQIVRDILARNGLELRSINGVYHVGRPELISSIEAIGSAGGAGEKTTKILRLRRGTGADLLALARQVVPRGVELIGTNSPDTIIVRAGAGEIDQVERLLKGLMATGVTEERVAVIPLRQSAPDKIAAQMSEFFRSRNNNSVSVIPLEGQQALLVSAKEAGALEGVKRLAEAMDTEIRDEISLRVIPLQHVVAEEIAQRLQAIFGAGGTGGGPVPAGPAAFGGLGGLGGAGNPLSNFGQIPGQSSGQVPEALRDPAPLPRVSPVAATDGDTTFTAPPLPPRGGNTFAAGPNGPGPGGPGPNGALPQGLTRIVADKNTNALMVYSTYSTFKKIRDVLRALDVPPAQVVIEATIVEVDLTDQLQQGVQFFLSGTGFVIGSGNTADVGLSGTTAVGAGSSGGTGGTPTTSNLGGVSSSTGFGGLAGIGVNLGNGLRADAVVRALQGITRVKVISSPYLTVLNGKQARLVIGDQIPYAQRSQSANNLGNTTVTQEIVIKDTGIILDVTPRIQANNSVALKVNQSVSIPQQSVLGGALTPVISTRSVESDILLQSGRTVLLGGLIQDRLEQQEDGVPVLRTVPIVGDLFKQKIDNTRRVELVLMLTPRVTRNSSQIEDLARLLQEQMHTR